MLRSLLFNGRLRQPLLPPLWLLIGHYYDLVEGHAARVVGKGRGLIRAKDANRLLVKIFVVLVGAMSLSGIVLSV